MAKNINADRTMTGTSMNEEGLGLKSHGCEIDVGMLSVLMQLHYFREGKSRCQHQAVKDLSDASVINEQSPFWLYSAANRSDKCKHLISLYA